MNLEVKIPFSEGLHARPATELVKICSRSQSDIKLSKGDLTINPKSMLGIMSLGASYGDTVVFHINGEDEEKAAQELNNFFNV